MTDLLPKGSSHTQSGIFLGCVLGDSVIGKSGIGTYLKTSLPGVEVVGCSPENSAVMMASVEAGRVLELPSLPTLSDGTAGGIEPGALTFELCSTVVDRWIDVTESEISSAIRLFLVEHRMAVEGAAGVALAAFKKTAADYRGKRVAIIICGGLSLIHI